MCGFSCKGTKRHTGIPGSQKGAREMGRVARSQPGSHPEDGGECGCVREGACQTAPELRAVTRCCKAPQWRVGNARFLFLD